jgi:hypothetical protein
MFRWFFSIAVACIGVWMSAEAQQASDALTYAPIEYRNKDQWGFDLDVATSLNSTLIFRGRHLYDGLNLQPSIQPRYSFGEYGTVSGLLWFLAPLEGESSTDTYFAMDEGLAYDYTVSRFTFSVGQYWYGYPKRSDSINSTSELWGALSLDTILSPSFTVYWDYDAFDSLYYEISLSHTFQQSGEGAFNLTFFSSLGFASHAEKVYDHGGLVQITSGVSTDLAVGPMIVRPMLAYTGSDDGATTNKAWGGVSLIVTF